MNVSAYAPTSVAWFVHHEFTLFWRDWLSMMTAGKPHRRVLLFIVLAVVGAAMHGIAAIIILSWVEAGIRADKATLVLLSGCGLLATSLMLAQALESVTRAYYTRADLDLVLSSPASSHRLFAVRTLSIAALTGVMACLLAGSFINVLAIWHHPAWLCAYLVLLAIGAIATALAVLTTLAMFRFAGPRRTRLIAQIIAAIVGAGFIIGIQAMAILWLGNLSRFEILRSTWLVERAPNVHHWAWLPARAAMGQWSALVLFCALAIALLAAVTVHASPGFGRIALTACATGKPKTYRSTRPVRFRNRNPHAALMRKELTLLVRDPWLISQSLMQILYLAPPAMMLWLFYGQSADTVTIVVPVIVMASGQLAGGLAWLAISGEDAPDLVNSAPVTSSALLTAKVKAVLCGLGLVLCPLLAFLAMTSLWLAAVAALGITASALSATLIQIWFRGQMERSMFRRRQVSSRAATICEAFASIMWAGAAGLMAYGSAMAVIAALIALLVLGCARLLSPTRD